MDGYTIKRGVGHGGFGEVYYATSDAGKEVALKLIRRNLDVELRGIKQCLNLKHPNLLAIFDIRQDAQSDHWVVMEYVAGDALEEVVAASPNGLPIEDTLGWFHGIGAGVAYLHDHGIVHRDLKPGNIFSDEGVVKIGDYGLSKFVSCSRRSGQTESVGTVHYMAPEVANGRYGKEIDIYALGVVLYELLTGHVPFEGESVGEVLMKHLTAEPDVSMLAEPYRSVVARALQKDPAKRFKSVAEMLAGLPRPMAPIPGAGRLPSAAGRPASAGDSPFTTGPITAEAVDDEPIMRAVLELWQKTRATWNESNFNTPTKIVLLVVGLFALLATAQVLIPLSVLLLMLYGGYRVVRTIVLSHDSKKLHNMPTRAAPPPVPPPVAQPSRVADRAEHHRARDRHLRRKLPRWSRSRDEAIAALVMKSPMQRATDLIGSMLAGGLVAVTMCLVLVLAISYQSNMPQPEQFAWLVLMSIVGTWALLVPSKLWEGTRGEPMLRRFILMVIGLGLGLLAFAAADVLMVNWTDDLTFPRSLDYRLPAHFYGGDGRPLLAAYLAVFGSLLPLLRWWRQADPLRITRLSLWSLFVSAVVAAVVAAVWHFPQPWLVVAVCAISVSVQLASPWVHPRKRRIEG